VLASIDPLALDLALILDARPSYGPPLFAIFADEPAGGGINAPPAQP
jgi:hypothetical protein